MLKGDENVNENRDLRAVQCSEVVAVQSLSCRAGSLSCMGSSR